MSDLLRQHAVAVGCRGELVTLQLGNLEYAIEFDLALQCAAVMRHQTGIAKLNAGIPTNVRGLQALGVLHDSSAPRAKRKRFIEVILPRLLRRKDLECYAEGQFVVLKIRRTVAKMPWPVTRKLSQWLRVRGKEAKRAAGEHAHWSQLVDQVAADGGARGF